MKTAAPEKKSVKTLKGQLFGAVSMMLVAAIALGTSTYAWFINNQTVEVQKMNLTVSTSTSLQVAVHRASAATDFDTKPLTPYKNVVATDDISGTTTTDQGGWANMFSTAADYLMVPASIGNTGLAAATPKFFAATGHMNATGDKLDTFAEYTSAATKQVGEGAIKKLPLSFLSSSDLNVYFGKAALTSIADLITAKAAATGANPDPTQDELDAQAEAIKSALRVAIVPKTGTATPGDYTAGTPLVFQFDDGEPHRTGNANNTDYNNVSLTTIPHNEKLGQYQAISGIDATSKKVNAAEQQTAQVPNADASKGAELYRVAVTDNSGVYTVSNYTDNLPLFTLKAEKARNVDIYIWLEGTDQDCLNALSQCTFDIALPFAGAPDPTTARPPVTP